MRGLSRGRVVNNFFYTFGSIINKCSYLLILSFNALLLQLSSSNRKLNLASISPNQCYTLQTQTLSKTEMSINIKFLSNQKCQDVIFIALSLELAEVGLVFVLRFYQLIYSTTVSSRNALVADFF